jgi:predicted nucleic acid-binding protein
MTVVSDASPMINLARIEALHLLAELYETVVLPEAVWTEIVVEGEGQPGARAVQSATWIERQAVANRDLVRALRQDLDKGEAEAVALTVETEDVLLLMDERLGRETADHFDLACVGLIGVLIEAKENEHVDALRPYLQALRSEAGFWISDQLYRRVLRDEGELP